MKYYNITFSISVFLSSANKSSPSMNILPLTGINFSKAEGLPRQLYQTPERSNLYE